mmetsp:Transcript_92146/g.231717  ORF Transcript_92146/g.231717 Transcript_92146/m.231717 type:complete len:207 (-) Transcript_92146:556-1176(-)
MSAAIGLTPRAMAGGPPQPLLALMLAHRPMRAGPSRRLALGQQQQRKRRRLSDRDVGCEGQQRRRFVGPFSASCARGLRRLTVAACHFFSQAPCHRCRRLPALALQARQRGRCARCSRWRQQRGSAVAPRNLADTRRGTPGPCVGTAPRSGRLSRVACRLCYGSTSATSLEKRQSCRPCAKAWAAPSSHPGPCPRSEGRHHGCRST